MPRRSSYTRRTFFRRRFPTRITSGRSRFGFARRNATSVSRFSGKELKCFDTVFRNFTVPPFGAPNIETVNNVQQGSAFFNRIGTKIGMKSILINWHLFPQNTIVSCNIRISLIYDRQSNGAYPGFSEIFQTVDGLGALTSTHMSLTNIVNKDRFVILKDLNIPIVASTTTASVQIAQMPTLNWSGSWYVPLNNMETTYKTSTNSIGDISTGNLFLMIGANVANVGISAHTVTRLRYID